jgi:hypothetical protein
VKLVCALVFFPLWLASNHYTARRVVLRTVGHACLVERVR